MYEIEIEGVSKNAGSGGGGGNSRPSTVVVTASAPGGLGLIHYPGFGTSLHPSTINSQMGMTNNTPGRGVQMTGVRMQILPHPQEARKGLYAVIPSVLISLILFMSCIFSLEYFRLLQQLDEMEPDSINASDYSELTKEKLLGQVNEHPSQYRNIGLPGEIVTICVIIMCSIDLIFGCVLNGRSYSVVLLSKPMVLLAWMLMTFCFILICALQVIYMVVAMVNLPDAHDHYLEIRFKVPTKKSQADGADANANRKGFGGLIYRAYYYSLVVNLGLGVIFLVVRPILIYVIYKLRKQLMRKTNLQVDDEPPLRPSPPPPPTITITSPSGTDLHLQQQV